MKLLYSGKVRDLYDANGDLMMVASDRISAFDVVLDSVIPKKGIVLTQLTLFNLKHYSSLLQKHQIQNPLVNGIIPDEFKHRTMIVKKCKPFAIEAIVRGYLFGSVFKEYSTNGTVAGQEVEKGLQLASKFKEPLFTPSTKAELGDHDMNISIDEMKSICGEEISNRIKDFSIDLYKQAAKFTEERGILLCDTKFEFGILDGEIYLIDEVLTPDSSRYWFKESYQPGISPPSFDKQFVRDYLIQNGLQGKSKVVLPENIINRTFEKYVDCYERITNNKFDF